MNYKEYVEQLHENAEKHRIEFMKLDDEVRQVKGFADIDLMPRYATSHKQWQDAHNEYWGVVCLIRDNKIDLDSEVAKLHS